MAGRFVGSPETSAVGSGVPLAIYGSHTTLKQLVDIVMSKNIDPERYLVALRAGADWGAAKDGIRSLGASGISASPGQRSSSYFRPAVPSFLRIHGAGDGVSWSSSLQPESGSFCTRDP